MVDSAPGISVIINPKNNIARMVFNSDLNYALGDMTGHGSLKRLGLEYERLLANDHYEQHSNYHKNPTGNRSKVVRQMDEFMHHSVQQEYSEGRLLVRGAEHGIQFFGIDSADQYNHDAFTVKNRLNTMNAAAVKAVEAHVSPGEGYLLFCGEGHVTSAHGEKGLSELLGISAISVGGHKDSAVNVARNAASRRGVMHDFVIQYPTKTIGAPKQILSPATWFSALTPQKRMTIIGSATAAVVGIGGIGYYLYQDAQKKNSKGESEKSVPKTQLAQNHAAVLASRTATQAHHGAGATL